MSTDRYHAEALLQIFNVDQVFRVFEDIEDLDDPCRYGADATFRERYNRLVELGLGLNELRLLRMLEGMRREHGGGVRIYVLDGVLARLLMETDPSRVRAENFSTPCKTFFLTWPGGWRLASGYEIAGCYVSQGIGPDLSGLPEGFTDAEGTTAPLVQMLVLLAVNGHDANAGVKYVGIELRPGESLLESLERGLPIAPGPATQEQIDRRRFFALVINACLYITSPQAEIEHWINPRLKKATEELEALKASKRGKTNRAKTLEQSIKTFNGRRERWLVKLPAGTRQTSTREGGPRRPMFEHMVSAHFRTYWMKPENVVDPSRYRAREDGRVAVPHFLAPFLRGKGHPEVDVVHVR